MPKPDAAPVIFMTAQRFREIRLALGLSELEMGFALGKRGNDNTIKSQIHKYEKGHSLVGKSTAEKMESFALNGVPESSLPEIEGRQHGATVERLDGTAKASGARRPTFEVRRTGGAGRPSASRVKLYDLTRE